MEAGNGAQISSKLVPSERLNPLASLTLAPRSVPVFLDSRKQRRRLHTQPLQHPVVVSPLFPTRYGNGSGPEHGVLHGSLRGDGTELELALIELIDDLAHGCLIQIGGNSQRPLRLCGRRDRRNCGRRRDERRLSRPRRAGCRQEARQDYKPHSRIQPSAEGSAHVAVDSRVGD